MNSFAGLVSTEPSGANTGRQPGTSSRAPDSSVRTTVFSSSVHQATRSPSGDQDGSTARDSQPPHERRRLA